MVNQKFLYQQVYQDLKQSILNGEYKTGDKLPSENMLCQIYKTTRVTIRQAFDELLKEGFVYKEHGRGTFVRAEVRALGLLSFKGFSEVVGVAHEVKTKILQRDILSHFPKDFFYELSEKERETGCVYLKRLRFADKDPVMLEFTYLPNFLFPIFSKAKEENEETEQKTIGNVICEGNLLEDSLFRTLVTQFNIEVIGLEQSIRAISGEKSMTDLLKMDTNAPLLYVSRKYITSKPNFFIYSTLFCNTGKYAISNHF